MRRHRRYGDPAPGAALPKWVVRPRRRRATRSGGRPGPPARFPFGVRQRLPLAAVDGWLQVGSRVLGGLVSGTAKWALRLSGMVGLAAALVAAVLGMHALLGTSQDAWAASIQTVTTVVLVVITAVYVYFTYDLVRAQRVAPRAEGHEAAVRDLATFVGSHRQVIWTAAQFFPVNTNKRPPMLRDVIASRDALTELRNHLLEVLPTLPRYVAAPSIGAAAHLLDAEGEFHALAAALLDETQAGLAAQRSWTWAGAQEAHLASADLQRQEPWDEVLGGRRFALAQDRWEKLDEAISEWLSK